MRTRTTSDACCGCATVKWSPPRTARAGGDRACSYEARLEPTGPVLMSVQPSPAITVAFAVPKGDRPELIVQKLTEIGADVIVPMMTARSIVRWDAAAARKHGERLSRVAREAAMQSRRTRLPTRGAPDLVHRGRHPSGGGRRRARRRVAGGIDRRSSSSAPKAAGRRQSSRPHPPPSVWATRCCGRKRRRSWHARSWWRRAPVQSTRESKESLFVKMVHKSLLCVASVIRSRLVHISATHRRFPAHERQLLS